jgi:hypothetical protein
VEVADRQQVRLALGEPGARDRALASRAVSVAGRPEIVLAGEQPVVDVQYAFPPADPPPLPQQGGQPGRKHGVAIPPALAALDPQQHALAVDVAHLEGGDLGRAQAGAIGDRQRRLASNEVFCYFA